MTEFFNELQTLSALSVTVRLLLSALCGAIIGYERGRHGRAAGLRTHILVALGSAMASLVGAFMVSRAGFSGDPSRIASGVVSGIGFLCAGIILVKNNSKVTGLTTAAAMWTTGTVGLAFGAGFYHAGLIGSAILFICLKALTVLEIKQKKDLRYIIEIDDAREANRLIDSIAQKYPMAHSFEIQSAKSNISGYVDIYVNIMVDEKAFSQELLQNPHVVFVSNE